MVRLKKRKNKMNHKKTQEWRETDVSDQNSFSSTNSEPGITYTKSDDNVRNRSETMTSSFLYSSVERSDMKKDLSKQWSRIYFAIFLNYDLKI